LHYEPHLRVHPFDSLSHPFFDELREPGARLPNGKPLPNLFNFTDSELKMAEEKGLAKKLLPADNYKKLCTDRASRQVAQATAQAMTLQPIPPFNPANAAAAAAAAATAVAPSVPAANGSAVGGPVSPRAALASSTAQKKV